MAQLLVECRVLAVLRDYLTDGVGLYRFLGWGLAGDFAQLEDCRSLELVVVPTRDLRERRVRRVTPSPVAR